MYVCFSVFYKITFLNFGYSHVWKRNGLVATMIIGKENRKGLWADFFPSNFLSVTRQIHIQILHTEVHTFPWRIS